MTKSATRMAGGMGLLLALGSGCVDSQSSDDGAKGGEPEVRALTAQLVQAESCDDLLSEIHADAIARVDLAAERIRTGLADGDFASHNHAGRDGVAVGAPPFAVPAGGTNGAGGAGAPPPATPPTPTTPLPAPAPTPVPGTPGTDSDPASAPAPGPTSPNPPGEATQEVESGPDGYSDTNRQVAEVDEADIVKVDADGDFVYLLHSDRIIVLKSWPAAETAIANEVVLDQPLTGRPYEMFVKDGKVAVFSAVSNSHMLDAESDGGDPKPRVVATTEPGCFNCFYDDMRYTKVTLLDADADSSQVTRELFVEGSYVSSRRYDSTLRAVMRGGFKAPSLYEPSIEFYDPWGEPHDQAVIDDQIDAWRDRTVQAILASDLDAWLPKQFERVDGELQELERQCGQYYIPAPGLVNQGLTSVLELDMADAEAPLGGAAILGDAAQVYSNTDTLLLAHSDWRGSIDNPEGAARTVLHAFTLDGGIAYAASGFVPGSIQNQFSLDERDGVVRVTTVSESWENDFQTDNRLRTLAAENGELEVIGETPNLGKPRETIRSTRFVGDRAYVVTFEQTDPLVVVDLSDPADPTVLGQVEIPGFSTYMHPLGDDHLLTIGEFIDPDTGGNRSLQLQIFDVSDPTDPQQAHSHVFPLGGSSLAQQQHKAFNYFADRQLLAFPYENYSTLETSLEVFRVDPSDGIEPVGSIDHTGLLSNCANHYGGPVPNPAVDPAQAERWEREAQFYNCPTRSVRRGVFIDEFIMSIGYQGVLVHRVGDLSAESSEVDAVAQVDLPTALYSDWQGNGWFGGGFVGGGPIGAAPPVGLPPVPMPTRPPMDPIPMAGASAPPPDEPIGDDGGVNVSSELQALCEETCAPVDCDGDVEWQVCVDQCLEAAARSRECGDDPDLFQDLLFCCFDANAAAGMCIDDFSACLDSGCGEMAPPEDACMAP